ncbi:MAG: asparagine synthase (glutamine-hydrolyzing) [Nitrospira sp.]|nr:asparagine synthase (glutamine-hydrolyzing) [Nitrospira sp.]
MCGIAGWLGILPNGRRHADSIIRKLHHRGPDGKGIRFFPKAALIHTRLSIIDLSPAGTQPLANESGTIWTVFNGEVYNHRDIQEDLERKGHVFQGYSDSEILPHLFEEEEGNFIWKLRGMFALAIYDSRNETLLLARDRFGIKPLYYVCNKEWLAFASEINALLLLPEMDIRPNRQAIHDFAALGYIPAPETFYQGIKALQPGEVLVAELNGEGISHQLKPYHQWAICPNFSLSLGDAVDQASEMIDQAVHRQMESDVPLAALLSGGIDSSLISLAAQNGLKDRLKTFNVRFHDEAYDETWAAVATAKHIGSHHQTLEMEKGMGTWEHITGMLRHAGQPFADTSLFAVNAVCRLMREHVTVALSGDGGDEGFGGYNFYWQIARIARYQRWPSWTWQIGARVLSPLARHGMIPSYLPSRIRDLAMADDTSIMQHMFSWIGEVDHAALCRDKNLLPVRRFFEKRWNGNPMPRLSRLEQLSAHATEINIRLVLSNDFLFKVDSASMKESLEVRVPMLDEDLFAFGLTLPHALKVKGRTCKRVLRGVAHKKLPFEVARKPKMGFGVPMDTWVDSKFKEHLKESLLGSGSRLSEFFIPDVYQPMLEAFCAGRPYHGVSRQGLYQRAIVFLAVQLALEATSPSQAQS